MDNNLFPLFVLVAFCAGGVVGYLFGAKVVTRAFEIVDQIEKKVQSKIDQLKG